MKKYLINSLNRKSVISREIYGHFSEHLGRCIYGGIYVGDDKAIPNKNGMRRDVVEALKNIKVPVLRWPGGCFADDYHWKDGIGAKDVRKHMVNTNWGGVVEDNSFGTHEFLELCGQLECEPYINVNVGSGTVAEAEEWIEYMTFDGSSPMAELRKKNGAQAPWKIKYIGVGNENWGCGGNMTPEYYTNEYCRYQSFIKNYGDNRIFRIACGPNSDDYSWTDVVMKNAAKEANGIQLMDGLSLHYYTIPTGEWAHKGSATDFDEALYYTTLKATLKMEELVANHSKIMDRYDPQKKVALLVDEWGSWYDVEPGTNPGFLYQQNSMRDALIAGINLNIFNRHSDRVRMANIAQLANVLQSPILTEGDKMVLTPTYHVFDLYKAHQGAELLDSFIQTETIDCGGATVPCLHESASISDGVINATICNLSSDKDFDIELSVFDTEITRAEAMLLHNKINACNSFENPANVRPEKADTVVKDGKIIFKIPACSVMSLKLS